MADAQRMEELILDEFPISRLSDGDFDLAGFVCDDAEIDDFLHDNATEEDLMGRIKTWILHRPNSREVLAFVSIGMGHVNLHIDGLEQPSFVGVVHVAYIGTSKKHEKKGYGSHLILWALQLSRTLSRDIGCRGIGLNCRSHRLDWYRERLRFTEYGKPTKDERGLLHRMFLNNRSSAETGEPD